MDFIKKHKEAVLYIVFGALTTLVNFVVFILFNLLLGEELYLVSNFIAWVFAVIFAFVVNKLIVFESRSMAVKTLFREIGEFTLARVFSFGIEELGLFLLVDLIAFSFAFELLGFSITWPIIVKLMLAVIVVILNYFFGKFIIFKKKSADRQHP